MDDARRLSVGDPVSQKSYLWNGANPAMYSDPTGYYSYTPPVPDVDTSFFYSWPGISKQFIPVIATVMVRAKPRCLNALAVAHKDMGSVSRANKAWSLLVGAASRHGISPSLLAAIGVRESGFENIAEIGGGPGMGVFQLTVGAGVTNAEASDLPWAANYAAAMLASNQAALARAFPNFNSQQLLQATAASYNGGLGIISGNPNTIDRGTTGNNYGSNVVGLMSCF